MNTLAGKYYSGASSECPEDPGLDREPELRGDSKMARSGGLGEVIEEILSKIIRVNEGTGGQAPRLKKSRTEY